MDKEQYPAHKYYYDIDVKVLNKTQLKSRTLGSEMAKVIVGQRQDVHRMLCHIATLPLTAELSTGYLTADRLPDNTDPATQFLDFFNRVRGIIGKLD